MCRPLCAVLLALASLFLGMPAWAQGAIEIRWRVENPFRFFTDPARTERHRAALAALDAQTAKAFPVLGSERVLAARAPRGWAAETIDSTCWTANRNRHLCPSVSDYLSPRSHAVIAEVVMATAASEAPAASKAERSPTGAEVTRSLAGARCSWRLAGRAITPAAVDCASPVRLVLPYPAGGKIEVAIEGGSRAATVARVRDLLVVGMGDSFASGEGNPDVAVRLAPDRAADYDDGKGRPELKGLPTRVGRWRAIGDKAFLAEGARWLDRACHRSLYSHQLRAALQLSLEDPHRAVTWVGYACTGAATTFGLFLHYKGNEWVPKPPDQPQISAIAREQCGARAADVKDLPEAYHMGGKLPELRQIALLECNRRHARRIDLLMVSIGGNDIGFSRLVANAVLADRSRLKRLGGWFGQVHRAEQAIAAGAELVERYKALNRAIHSILQVPWGEADRVLLTAYPPLAVMDDGRSVCPSGRDGMTVAPDLTLSRERAEEGQRAAEHLNGLMKAAADRHGWTFVDAHRARFAGRGICAGSASAPASLADDLRLPRFVDGRWEPFEPTAWQPYASRKRWYRTPNDAYLTGHFHVGQSLLRGAMRMQSLTWMQLLLAATYSGAFHPTAEGQAAIADAVVEKARAVLTRYR
jgi:lysophospholipase L1-like esterase